MLIGNNLKDAKKDDPDEAEYNSVPRILEYSQFSNVYLYVKKLFDKLVALISVNFMLLTPIPLIYRSS